MCELSIQVFLVRLRRSILGAALMAAALPSPTAAQDCPASGLSQHCCNLAKPLDNRSVDDGGYGWHPGPSGEAGLCQGLASRNTSGGLISLADLREALAFNDPPGQVIVVYRPLPVTPTSPVLFNGTPLRPGNPFFIAGSFVGENELIWITRPFVLAGQTLDAFGFETVFRHAGRIVHTPLIFSADDRALGKRSEVRAIFRSTQPIGAASVTVQPIALSDLEPTGEESQVLELRRPSARQLELTLPNDLPEAFQLSVIACDAGDSACTGTENRAPRQTFRIIWPKP